VASSAATTRALWAVAASNSSVAGTVRAQVGPSAALNGAFAATPFMLDGL